MHLLSLTACFLLLVLKTEICPRYVVLRVFLVNPMQIYSSLLSCLVTLAWYIILVLKHGESKGQVFSFLELQHFVIFSLLSLLLVLFVPIMYHLFLCCSYSYTLFVLCYSWQFCVVSLMEKSMFLLVWGIFYLCLKLRVCCMVQENACTQLYERTKSAGL